MYLHSGRPVRAVVTLRDILELPLTLVCLLRIPNSEALDHMIFVSQAMTKERKNCVYMLVLKIMRYKHKRGLK